MKTLLKFEKRINEYVISGIQVQKNEYSQENSIWKVLRKQFNEFPVYILFHLIYIYILITNFINL